MSAERPGRWGANHGRLVTIKRRYDPYNTFRLNHNITPVLPGKRTTAHTADRPPCSTPGASRRTAGKRPRPAGTAPTEPDHREPPPGHGDRAGVPFPIGA